MKTQDYIPSKATVKSRLTSAKAWELPKQGKHCFDKLLSGMVSDMKQNRRLHLPVSGQMLIWILSLLNIRHGRCGLGWHIGRPFCFTHPHIKLQHITRGDKWKYSIKLPFLLLSILRTMMRTRTDETTFAGQLILSILVLGKPHLRSLLSV
jgi:hypothetical protein